MHNRRFVQSCAPGVPGRRYCPVRPAGPRTLAAGAVRILCVGLCCLVAGAGCAPVPPNKPTAEDAKNFAQAHGFSPMIFHTGRLDLAGFMKAGGGKTLVAYIEGDGEAFVDRTTPSDAPSPRNPLVLKLASLDPAASVLYLARPCQYLSKENWTGCEQSLWTVRRYGPEVLKALGDALDQAKSALGVEHLSLVGYSGGGVLAMLLAATRKDVADVVTVAANLDIAEWTQIHSITPLSGSLNPADYAAGYATLPQTHFCGSNDKVSPPLLCRDFVALQGPSTLARCVEIDGAAHDKWDTHWLEMLDLHRQRSDVPPL